jgi:hypothetical protein
LNNTKEIKQDKYSQLEKEVKARRESAHNYNGIKRMVISADIQASLSKLPKYLIVAEELRLGEKSRNELQDLYNETINPLILGLFAMRTLVIGIRAKFGFGDNVAPKEVLSNEEKDMAINKFTKFLDKKLNEECLKDKTNIKAVIIYPLIVATINTWRKFDSEFADNLIEKIKSNETDERLKKIIAIIDIRN